MRQKLGRKNIRTFQKEMPMISCVSGYKKDMKILGFFLQKVQNGMLWSPILDGYFINFYFIFFKQGYQDSIPFYILLLMIVTFK